MQRKSNRNGHWIPIHGVSIFLGVSLIMLGYYTKSVNVNVAIVLETTCHTNVLARKLWLRFPFEGNLGGKTGLFCCMKRCLNLSSKVKQKFFNWVIYSINICTFPPMSSLWQTYSAPHFILIATMWVRFGQEKLTASESPIDFYYWMGIWTHVSKVLIQVINHSTTLAQSKALASS